jgi:predicted hotdog family 3-hydroxylacyl-ACP dehydratase
MAQTAAVCAGARRRAQGLPVELGLLVACPSLRLSADWLSAGDELLVEARRAWAAPPLIEFDCRVLRSGAPIAEATLHFYLGPPQEADPS